MDCTELAPGIIVYKNVIENNECLINDLEDAANLGLLTWVDAGVKSDKDVVVDKNTRDTKSIGISYLNSIASNSNELTLKQKTDLSFSKIFFDSFSVCENDYMSKFGFYTEWHDSYGILKYGVGQKFTNHIDDHKDYHRRISSVYYINDDYSGGEISFPRFSITYKPNKNELLIFPSTYVYNHSVSEVTDGIRYAVVSWMK